MARKILLADDSVTAQNMGRKILSDAGYEVIAVNNGSAALKKIAELKPELVILDVYMPGYSGLEVCQRLKESPETSRIPVLLSVGKLEPFKPQEAQRVRADAYIVKPFEASELLSALAKLEDKIVPRAEDSKHRRATASSEVAGSAKVAATDASGKSRISFPRKKTEPEAKPADEAEIYNIVNRDLRTVVENPAENLDSKEEKSEKEHAAVTEASVDVAALAPTGFPQDVTPEEIAAIASAAAQIQLAGAILKEESQASAILDAEPIHPAPESIKNQEIRAEERTEDVRAEASAPQETRIEETRTEETRIEGVRAQEVREEEVREEIDGDPVTMAAATESTVAGNATGSRWIAVPAPLGSEEAALSLDQEMQRSFAAFGSAPESIAKPTEPATPPQIYDLASAIAQEIQIASLSTATPEAVSKVENTAASVSVEEPAVEVAQAQVAQAEAGIEPSSVTHLAAAPVVVNAEPADLPALTNSAESHAASEIAPPPSEMPSLEIATEAQPSSEFIQVHPEPTPVAEFTSSATDNQGTYTRFIETQFVETQFPAPALPEVHKSESTLVVESPSTQAVSESDDTFAAIVRDPEPVAETKLDPEAVKSTAAAWASWRQIRDNSQPIPAIAAKTDKEDEIVAPRPSSDTTAMAVAAGAEHTPQDASASTFDRHSAEVASIVDSVLADLRPKLMEEISRKMAQKK